ncbi:hypothetical protein [Cohnella sp. GbtcB17]|uniref:hypothetical protein n=1 Tax=Cohnella sp. GbtcB17 TaxID=2824762 RepID=UPI001C303C80|nr:hypothetical protein [Cohnella sp. GbtcB17]
MKKYLLIACTVLAVTVYSSVELSGNKTKAAEEPAVESQIVETASGRLIQIRNPQSLKELVDHSPLIVKGEIVKAENVQEEVQLIEGTPERTAVDAQGGKSTHIRSGTNYTISVTDVIKGQLEDKEIILFIREDEINLRPELKISDELIFNLAFSEPIGRYIDVHPVAGYLKVNADNKVIPMFDSTKEFANLKNEAYDEVKRKIKDIE